MFEIKIYSIISVCIAITYILLNKRLSFLWRINRFFIPTYSLIYFDMILMTFINK